MDAKFSAYCVFAYATTTHLAIFLTFPRVPRAGYCETVRTGSVILTLDGAATLLLQFVRRTC